VSDHIKNSGYKLKID